MFIKSLCHRVFYAMLNLHLRSFLFYPVRSGNNSCEISKIKKVVRLGVKDQGLQEYLKDNERFADLGIYRSAELSEEK